MYESKDELVIAAELPGLIHPGSAAAAA